MHRYAPFLPSPTPLPPAAVPSEDEVRYSASSPTIASAPPTELEPHIHRRYSSHFLPSHFPRLPHTQRPINSTRSVDVGRDRHQTLRSLSSRTPFASHHLSQHHETIPRRLCELRCSHSRVPYLSTLQHPKNTATVPVQASQPPHAPFRPFDKVPRWCLRELGRSRRLSTTSFFHVPVPPPQRLRELRRSRGRRLLPHHVDCRSAHMNIVSVARSQKTPPSLLPP